MHNFCETEKGELEMISFSSLTTALDNNLLTFRLDALVLLKVNEAKG